MYWNVSHLNLDKVAITSQNAITSNKHPILDSRSSTIVLPIGIKIPGHKRLDYTASRPKSVLVKTLFDVALVWSCMVMVSCEQGTVVAVKSPSSCTL